jgi:hypothetical protein
MRSDFCWGRKYGSKETFVTCQNKFREMRNAVYGVLLGVGALALMASEDGVAESQNKDRTGAPGSSPTCGACHSGGNFGASVAISLLDPLEGQVAFTEYQPGATYRLRVRVNHAQQSPQGFGLQVTAVLGGGSNAGTFSQPLGNTQLETVGSRHFFEHNAPSVSPDFEVIWTAPAPGSGPVTVYAAGVAVNGNGGTGGDQFAGGNAVFAEGNATGVAEPGGAGGAGGAAGAPQSVRVRPAGTGWDIEGPAGAIHIFDGRGREVAGRPLGEGTWHVEGSDLPRGVLVVWVQDAAGRPVAMTRWVNP